MTEIPKCPYCGAEMEDHSYCWICRKCHAGSPIVIYEEKAKSMTEDEKTAYAREAALRRAEPENRVLTVEEILAKANEEDWNFVWLEHKESRTTMQLCPWHRERDKIIFCGLPFDAQIAANIVEIRKTWRCWLRKPTLEQMRTEKWEE